MYTPAFEKHQEVQNGAKSDSRGLEIDLLRWLHLEAVLEEKGFWSLLNKYLPVFCVTEKVDRSLNLKSKEISASSQTADELYPFYNAPLG